jgi:hypothetical protein
VCIARIDSPLPRAVIVHQGLRGTVSVMTACCFMARDLHLNRWCCMHGISVTMTMRDRRNDTMGAVGALGAQRSVGGFLSNKIATRSPEAHCTRRRIAQRSFTCGSTVINCTLVAALCIHSNGNYPKNTASYVPQGKWRTAVDLVPVFTHCAISIQLQQKQRFIPH